METYPWVPGQVSSAQRLLENRRYQELAVACGGRVLQNLFNGPALPDNVLAHDVMQGYDLRRRWDSRGVQLLQRPHRLEDVLELGGKTVDLVVSQSEPCKSSGVDHVFASDRHSF